MIGPRTIRASYAWHVKGPVPRDFLCFVHFFKQGAPGAEILFQQDHALATPCSRWRAGQKLQDGPHDFAIPPGLPDGEYRWTIGLFTPTSGRAAMEGVQDGDSRILLGTLKVSDHGRKLTLVREKNPVDDPHAIYLEHVNSNNALVDFGPIRTDGSVVIRRAGERWTAWVFPRDREFTLLLDPRRFGRPDSISCDGGKLSVAPSPSTDGTCWKLPLNGSARYEWSSRQ